MPPKVKNTATSPMRVQKTPDKRLVIAPVAVQPPRDSFTAVLVTALEYVANDLRKKWKQFMMGVMTVFITVSFITFLGGIGQLGPITTLKTAIYHSGDFDVMFRGQTELTPIVIGNTNYYTDENDFFNAPYMSHSEKVRIQAQQSFMSRVPTVNFTQLLEIQKEAYKGRESPIELFPRWVASTKLINPSDKRKNTTANMIAGDSLLERRINVAPEFPKHLFQRHELATTTDVLDIIGLEEGDQVEANFDLFQLFSADFVKLKRLVFQFEMNYGQGDAVLEFLQMPKDLTFKLSDYLKLSDLKRIKRSDSSIYQCVTNIQEFIEEQATDEILASSIIEIFAPCLSEDLLTLKKNYTITKAVPHALGKWPETIGNSFFCESKWLVPDLLDMVKDRLSEVISKNTNDKANADTTVEELQALLIKQINTERQNEYAFFVLGKLNDREDLYIYGMQDQLIHSYNQFLWHFRNTVLYVRSPMFKSVEKFEYVNFQLGSIFFTIIFFLFLIDGILIYSIMLNDVEERTYEFAMLRTLGFKNSSLVTLLVIQACFQSIPATAIGFMLLYIFTQGAQVALYLFLGVSVGVKLHWTMVVLGLITGILVPMLSNIYPIKQALGTSLRNALDKFRAGVDEVQVEFVRMENAGTSPLQMTIGISIICTSALTLYFIPKALLDQSVKACFFFLNLLLLGCVLGIVFIGQAFALWLCRVYIDIILVLKPSDAKLRPLIHKNLESHSLKNLKANLLYSVTICFLVFQATNFYALFQYSTQMADVLFGGDINLLSVEKQSTPKFDEFKLRSVLTSLSEENGGKVKSYSMNSGNVRRQFYSPSEDQIKEFIKGDGLRWSQSKIGNVFSQAVERDVVSSLRIDDVWWPGEFMSQPLGQHTKIYHETEIINMLYDMEYASHYQQPYDTLQIISSQPNEGLTVDSQVINTLLPEGLRGEIFQEIGQHFTYCVSTDKPRKYGDFVYKANTCQVKFKMRAVAAWNKFPGFFKISGYEQFAKMGPGLLMTQNQMAHIVDRISSTLPEMGEIRKKVLLENAPATLNLVKENLQIKVVEGTTREERLQISNSVLAVCDDANLVLVDSITLCTDMQANMRIVDFFSACTSTICFILGMFQLIMTISANIKDSMWELGVLRSMGCTRSQITRVMVYELVSNTLSAMTLGLISGVIVSCLSIAQFYTLVELPLKVNLPTATIGVVCVCALLSLVAGSKYGTSELFSRNIASILKGC